MVYLSAEEITKSYTERVLLDKVSLTVGEGEKIGVIGVNGTGKTTLLRILAGAEAPDGGVVKRFGTVRVGFLSQNPTFPPETTVLEAALSSLPPKEREGKAYEAKTILTRLGITDFDQDLSFLSGGQKKRAAIAAALVCPCEVLILDEPTNHLDAGMVEWLEGYLSSFPGAIVMVTHDRYFLDRVVSRIVEVDRGKLFSYQTDYTGFLKLKAEREEMAAATERKRQALLKKELEWAARGARARGTKSQYRLDRLEELKESKGPAQEEALAFQSVSSRLGKQIIEAQHLFKAYGEETLIRDFSLMVQRDARIGIVGANGCGKTTLLKLLTGGLQPDSGQVKIGETVKIGYFSQECEDMDDSLTVIGYLREFGEILESPDGRLTAAQMLERFLFPSAMHYTQIRRLSGGEKRRLYLLGILMGAPNLLILDEPTNDLDIQTLRVLEDYIDSFKGAVISVSHDRYFLDRTVQTLLAFEGEGEIFACNGGYSDYARLKREKAPQARQKEKALPNQRGGHEKKLKFSFKEEREYETIDGEIAGLEEKLAENQRLTLSFASDFEKLSALLAEKEELERELEEKTERWVYLNELAEKIAAQNGGEGPEG